MKVALGAAKGLAFLHSPEAKVIYRDFKSSNILLDAVCVMILNFHCWIFTLSVTCADHLHLMMFLLAELQREAF